jgi:hypothetical protein
MSERTLSQIASAFSLGMLQDSISLYLTLKEEGYTMDDIIAYLEGLKAAFNMKQSLSNKEFRRQLKATNPEAYKAVVAERKRQWKQLITRSKQPDGTWKPCCKDKDKAEV